MDASNEPLFPFGFGLSYTQFELSDLQLSRTEINAGQSVEISLNVANIGRVAGDEVVQLYIRHREASVTRPIKELKGFKRVTLQAGERKQITFTLHANQLGYFNRTMRYGLEAGKVELLIGTSSVDIKLSGEINIGTSAEISGEQKVFFGSVDVLSGEAVAK